MEVRDTDGNLLTDRKVDWNSTNKNVARVTSSGRVTAEGAGTATITATADGQSGTSKITVIIPFTGGGGGSSSSSPPPANTPTPVPNTPTPEPTATPMPVRLIVQDVAGEVNDVVSVDIIVEQADTGVSGFFFEIDTADHQVAQITEVQFPNLGGLTIVFPAVFPPPPSPPWPDPVLFGAADSGNVITGTTGPQVLATVCVQLGSQPGTTPITLTALLMDDDNLSQPRDLITGAIIVNGSITVNQGTGGQNSCGG